MVRRELWFLCSSASTDVNSLKLKLTHCTNLLFWLCTPAHLKRSGAAVHSLNNNNKKVTVQLLWSALYLCVRVCVCKRETERAELQYLSGPDVSVMILARLYVLSGVAARVINTDKHPPASQPCGRQNTLAVHIPRFTFTVIQVNICYYRSDILHTHIRCFWEPLDCSLCVCVCWVIRCDA